MKTANFAINFKTATNTAGEKVKRDSISINYDAIESNDVASLNPDHIAIILNNSLVEYARKLVASKSDDWDYVPSSEEITVEAIYADLTQPSKRGQRLVTKAALAKFAEYYKVAAITLLGKSERAASNGALVIINRFAPIVANPTHIDAFISNLLELSSHDDFDIEYVELVAALIDILESAKQVEVDVNFDDL